MYADRVACCPLASYAEYAQCAQLRLEKGGTDRPTNRRTDGRQTYITLIAISGQRNNVNKVSP